MIKNLIIQKKKRKKTGVKSVKPCHLAEATEDLVSREAAIIQPVN